MVELHALYQEAVKVWRDLPFGPLEKNCIKAAAIGLSIYLIVLTIDRAYGTVRTAKYRSREFVHDVAYWFYYRSGLPTFLYMAAFFAALEHPLSFLDLKLLTPLPFLVQVVLYVLITDVTAYWVHRAQHHFPFLWAFHTTHHSQEQLNFFTGARFHPVDTFFFVFLSYIPSRILGADPLVWIPLFIMVWVIPATIHTQLPWRYGPLYKIVVSPVFHAYHHSVDPAHYNKNFCSTFFSFWDYLFGTAVRDGEPEPARFGLDTVKSTSLWSTLVTPFRLLYDFHAPRRRGNAADPL